ncbi:MAG: hypothetical protein H0T46_28910 [Deltaproteobacteria bacterium]|nr:hypothetical protein [Deltaproteobacteria bacterium]
MAIGVAALTIVIVAMLGRERSASTPSTAKQVDAELALTDARIASGRLVGPGSDEALDHLLAARSIDAEHPGVRERLRLLAAKFQQLADQAGAAGSLAEAAAHLQAILVLEPDNAAAAARVTEIEEQILARQRRRP